MPSNPNRVEPITKQELPVLPRPPWAPPRPEDEPDTPNRVAHVHHYVLKGSGLSCWAECDFVAVPSSTECGLCGRDPAAGVAGAWADGLQVRLCHGDNDPMPTCYSRWLYGARPTPCGHKLAGDNGPIVGGRTKIENAIKEAT